MGTKLPVGTSIYLVLNDWNIILNVECEFFLLNLSVIDHFITIIVNECKYHLVLHTRVDPLVACILQAGSIPDSAKIFIPN